MSRYIYSHWAAVLGTESDDESWDSICERLNKAGSDGWEVVETIKTSLPEYPDQYKIRFLLRYKVDGQSTS